MPLVRNVLTPSLGSSPSLTISTGVEGIFLAFTGYSFGYGPPTAVSIDGNACTEISTIDSDGTISWWYLANPPSGAQVISVTPGANYLCRIHGIEYTGIDGSTPYGTPVTQDLTPGATVNLSVSSEAGDEVLIASGQPGGGGGTYTPQGDTVELVDGVVEGEFSELVGYAPGAASVSVGWDGGELSRATVAFNVNAAAAGTPVSQTMGGSAEHLASVEATNEAPAEHIESATQEWQSPAEHLAAVAAEAVVPAEHRAAGIVQSMAGYAEHLASIRSTLSPSAEHIGAVSRTVTALVEHLLYESFTWTVPSEHIAIVVRTALSASEHLVAVSDELVALAEHLGAPGLVTQTMPAPAEHLGAVEADLAAHAEHEATIRAVLAASAEHLLAVAAQEAGSAEHLGPVEQSVVPLSEHLAVIVQTVTLHGEHDSTVVLVGIQIVRVIHRNEHHEV